MLTLCDWSLGLVDLSYAPPHAPPPRHIVTMGQLAANGQLQMSLADDSPESGLSASVSCHVSRAGSPRKTSGRHARFRSGCAPNIYWCSVSPDELRAHPRYVPLPPASDVRLAGPETFWWVRQDDPLWVELHEGVFTSRYLLAALGFKEPRAVRALGLLPSLAQPGAIEECYRQLSQPAPVGRLMSPCRSDVEAAHRANRAARREMKPRGAWPPVDTAQSDHAIRETVRARCKPPRAHPMRPRAP